MSSHFTIHQRAIPSHKHHLIHLTFHPCHTLLVLLSFTSSHMHISLYIRIISSHINTSFPISYFIFSVFKRVFYIHFIGWRWLQYCNWKLPNWSFISCLSQLLFSLFRVLTPYITHAHYTHTCIQTHCTHTCIENRKLVYLRGLAILIVTKKRVRHAKCTSQLYKLYIVHVSQTYIMLNVHCTVYI